MQVRTWLPDMDLNHDKQIQSLLCYRYTIGQRRASKLDFPLRESRLDHPLALVPASPGRDGALRRPRGHGRDGALRRPRRVQRRSGWNSAVHPRYFRPLNAGGDIAARCPYHVSV